MKHIQMAAKTAKNFVTRNSSTILAGFAVAGVFTTAVLAVKATPKALSLIAEAEEEKAKTVVHMNAPDNVVERTELTVWETMKAAWKCYIPAILTGGLTVACIVGGNRISHKKELALTAACNIAERSLSDFKSKATEVIGEEKVQEIQTEVNKANANAQTQVPMGTNIIVNGNDECDFFEAVSKTTFKSTINKVEKARNDMNYDMTYGNEFYKSFNEWLDALGIDSVPYGDEMGFSVDHGQIDTRIEATMDPDTMKPLFILDYGVRPVCDYMR